MYEYRASCCGVDARLLVKVLLLPFGKGDLGAFMSFMCSSITDKVSFITGESTVAMLGLTIGEVSGAEVRSAIGGEVLGCELDALAGRCAVVLEAAAASAPAIAGSAVTLPSWELF